MRLVLNEFSEVTLINFTDLTISEKSLVLNMRNHQSVRKWMFNSQDILESDHFEFIESLKNNPNQKHFLVKECSHTIGVINFNVGIKEDEATFGLYANPFEEKKGKGTILMEAVITYAFNFLKVSSLTLEVLESNIKAISLYRKYNFEFLSTELRNASIIRMKLKKEQI